MYYAIEIDSSLFLSGSFKCLLLGFSGLSPGCHEDIFFSLMWIYPLYL
jgi:hypothetical protein